MIGTKFVGEGGIGENDFFVVDWVVFPFSYSSTKIAIVKKNL